MKRWAFFLALLGFASGIVSLGARPVHAGEAASGPMMMDMTDAGSRTGNGATSPGQASFEALKSLFGKWEAPLGGGKTIVDTFQPFALGTAILAEEWVGGQQVTATVFYVVGADLWADHYCDYRNQPRYVARASADPSSIDLEFRDATNLDTHPTHFHATTWHLVDSTHMTQDWKVEGSPKGNHTVHLDFVRTGSNP